MRLGTLVGIAIAALLAIIVLFIAGYWAISYIYDNVMPYDPQVKLPFGGDYYQDLYISNNRSATNPTFDQLCAFLRQDDSDRSNLSRSEALVRLHDNAEAQGIRAGVAVFNPASTSSSPFQEVDGYNLFKTTDRGIIYVDCVGYDEAMGGDSILFYHQNYQGGTSYTAYYVPLENLSRADVRWNAYPDGVDLSQDQVKATGSFKDEMAFFGIDYYW